MGSSARSGAYSAGGLNGHVRAKGKGGMPEISASDMVVTSRDRERFAPEGRSSGLIATKRARALGLIKAKPSSGEEGGEPNGWPGSPRGWLCMPNEDKLRDYLKRVTADLQQTRRRL
ncbi:polyketide synthase docking domain-containing protein, partial [Streptomyces sp. NPDC059835]|uniref:polyketide synthase docking domain-containing protein n=1 Tax=unclassified Streptomyces TaxID=2593676 RepID=UPI0036548ABA